MKKIITLLTLLMVIVSIYGQSSWISGTNKIYANPTSTTLIGIGTSTPYDYSTSKARLDIKFSGADVLTYGNRYAAMGYVEVDGANFKGNIYSRLSYGGNWSAGGKGYGVSGNISALSKIYNSSYDQVYAAGGMFSIDFANPTGYNQSKEHVMAGVYSYITGSISSYPDIGVVSALYSQDRILGTDTWAGYFEGRVGVVGDIIAEEVNVQLYEDWADYVFDDTYELMPLKELESFIELFKHLPGIPNKVEVQKNGINLGVMNKRLVEKIEELTLYIIELEKRISTLEPKKTHLSR